MLPAELIRKKRDGGVLSPEELSAFVGSYVAGDVPDYQMSAMLMAIFFEGMTAAETANLTRTMMESGRVYHLKSERPLIDKHSTGGVGDKVSLVLAPLAAACGLAVPMVSGRGLGHTGGTLDKLESIGGLQVNLGAERFAKQVRELGFAMIGQSDDFVPADKRLYALRDVTGTVECIPLLCSSILSKKAASGARGVVMDVKCGSGAFMADIAGARALAKGLTETGEALGLPVRCVITNMDVPLGRAIGNANEMQESIECLKGGGPDDLRELTLELTAEMLLLGGVNDNVATGRARATAALDGGEALELFRRMVEVQGGDVRVVDEPGLMFDRTESSVFTAEQGGFVHIKNCRNLGLAALALGAGRRKSSDGVDHSVGLMMKVLAGERVELGQPMVEIAHKGTGLDECIGYLKDAIEVLDEPPMVQPLIIERVS